MKFMCGCDSEQCFTSKQAVGNLEIEICTQHQALPYGWRSPLVRVIDDEGRFIRNRVDYPVEREIYGFGGVIELTIHNGSDIRDQRDPEQLGNRLLLVAQRFRKETGKSVGLSEVADNPSLYEMVGRD